MKYAPLFLGVIIVSVLTFGLLYTVTHDVLVAPWAYRAADGRVHLHTKNITRFGGSADDVRRLVHRAVALDAAAPTPAISWQEEILRAVGPVAETRYVVALPSEGDDATAWALPGAYWAVYSRAPVIFVGRDAPGGAAEATVTQYGVPVYVLAPPRVVSDEVVERLAELAPTSRVSGDTLADHAVAIAEYRNPATGFGWGRTHEARLGYFEYVIAAPSEAGQALAALPLARSNAATFLFAGDDGGVPAATDRYVWSQRADWFVTPSEGPFRHLWIVGDRTSYAAQGRLDLAPEKAPYVSMGPVALGPLEGLAIVFIAFGIAGGLLVYAHAQRLLPEVMLHMKLAWAFTAMLLPVLGVVLYFAAYRRPLLDEGSEMVEWLRPPSIQAAAATAMGFGFGAPLMIAVGFTFAFFGFPLFFGPWADGWQFVFGAGMPLMMIAMYVFAVLFAWPFAQYPMRVMMGGPPRKAAWMALKVTAISMAAVSLGMMTANWWLSMSHIPMMPKEDEILWFGAIWLASAIGFLVAWPLNLPMVRTHMKRGSM